MNRSPKIGHWFLWASVVIPLHPQSPQWHMPSFSHLKRNMVEFTPLGLRINVDNSSSPVFFKLPQRIEVKNLKARGQLFDYQSVSSKKNSEEPDDLPLRIGLVETSESPPSWFQKLFLPQWIKDIFEVFPGRGIKKVRFLTLNPNKSVGYFRIHPKSDLLEETVAVRQPHSGPFILDSNFDPPVTTEALWFQSDGDDTHSRFSVLIQELSLELRD